MSIASWRNTALALATICGYQSWRGCASSAPASAQPAAHDERSLATCQATTSFRDSFARAEAGAEHTPERAKHHSRVLGVQVPDWVAHFLPQPGERLGDYRDRMLPLAELAIAPQRERVARLRDSLPALDAHQRAMLDAAVDDAASAIEQRVTAGITNGELAAATFKPMAGVELARDVLDIVDSGNPRFLSALTPEQRTDLASNRFDFADYLAFTAHWEDALRPVD
jgi:hypothetical protein